MSHSHRRARIERQVPAKLFTRQPKSRDPELLRELDQAGQDDRVQVHVEMPVDVGEGEARLPEPHELLPDLVRELRARRARELVAQADPDGAAAEESPIVHEGGDLPRRKRRASGYDDEVQSDREVRIRSRDRDGLRRGVARHHEARAGDDSLAVCPQDRLVDAVREPEVVGGHREPSQA